MTKEFRLENWAYYFGVFHGNVYDNPRFYDGTFIHTSTVTTEGPYKEGDLITTLNSVYRLGKQDV